MRIENRLRAVVSANGVFVCRQELLGKHRSPEFRRVLLALSLSRLAIEPEDFVRCRSCFLEPSNRSANSLGSRCQQSVINGVRYRCLALLDLVALTFLQDVSTHPLLVPEAHSERLLLRDSHLLRSEVIVLEPILRELVVAIDTALRQAVT